MVKKPFFKIFWDTKALEHLKEVLTYLEKQSPKASKIVKNAIVEKLKIIKTNPLIAEIDKLKDFPNNNFRAFVIYSYRVTYQIIFETKEIRVLRVRHTSREPIGY